MVQAHPSAAVFPGGEGLAGMQARAVAAVRRHDARIAAEHGPHAVWLACSHGDVIKAVLADALATHLDNFQRIMVDPGSISVVSLHRDPAVRGPGQRPRRRRRRADPAQATPSPQAEGAQLGRRGGRRPPAEWTCQRRAEGLLSISICPESFMSSVSPSASSPGPSASPATARSTCRPSRTPARSACCWRSSRSACSPSGSARCWTRSRAGSASESAESRPGRRPRPAGRAAGGGVPGRHDGSGLGRRLALDRRRAAGRHRGGGRRVGRARRHRGGPGRAARVPVPGAGQGVRRARGEGRLGRSPAVPAVRRAAERGRVTSAPG